MSGAYAQHGKQHCSMLRLLGDHLNMLGVLLKRYGSTEDYENALTLQQDLRSMATARDSPLGEGYVVPGASVDRNKWKPLELGNLNGPWDLPMDGVNGYGPLPVPACSNGFGGASAQYQPAQQLGFARMSREEKDDYRPMKLGFSREAEDEHRPMKVGFSRASAEVQVPKKKRSIGFARDSSMSNGHSDDAGRCSQEVWECINGEERFPFKESIAEDTISLTPSEKCRNAKSLHASHDNHAAHTRCTQVQHPLHPMAEKLKEKTHTEKKRRSEGYVDNLEQIYFGIFTTRTGEVAVATMILLNSFILGIQSDVPWDKWELVEVFFTGFFTFEMLVKICFSGCQYYWRGPDCYWNWFDGGIVIIALLDLIYSQLIVRVITGKGGENALDDIMFVKMIRLCRLARMVRLLRFKMFNQLKMMIQGVAAGLQVLFWAIVLLFFFVYVIAIIMQRSVTDTSDPRVVEAFSRMPWSMFTVFRCFTEGCSAHDGTPLQVILYQIWGAKFMIPYVLTFLFVTIGLFNLIMAIFVDNVMENTIQRKRDERANCAEYQEKALRKLLVDLCTHHGHVQKQERESVGQAVTRMTSMGMNKMSNALGLRLNKTNTSIENEEDMIVLDREAFAEVFENAAMQSMMDTLEVNTCDRVGLFDVLDADQSGELELDEVVVGLMNLRGPAEKTDMVGTLLCVRVIQQILKGFEEEVNHAHDQIYEKVMEMENKIDEQCEKIDELR